MSRIACLSLVLAACASTPHPISNTSTKPTRYTLDARTEHGGEGLHSMSQSWSTVSGSLEMSTKDRATLQLDITTTRSFIHCPSDWQGQERSTMQACAPADAKDSKITTTTLWIGEVQRSNGGLTVQLHERNHDATLRCHDQGSALACTFEQDARPSAMTFRLSAWTRSG